jgi:hypothetical protein
LSPVGVERVDGAFAGRECGDAGEVAADLLCGLLAEGSSDAGQELRQ